MDDAQAIDSVLRAHSEQQWTEFTQWPRGQYVILRCDGEPVGVFSTEPDRFDACPDLDECGLRAIFRLLRPGDLLRLKMMSHGSEVSVTRTDNEGVQHSFALERSRTEIEMAIAPVLGLAFIEIMRTLDAEVSDG